MYLLPAIDILGGKAVRLAKGDYAQVTVYNDDPIAQARAFEAAGARWLHVVDLDGAKSGAADVRLAKGDYAQVTVYNDDPIAQARAFEAAGARWLHVVDLDGAKSGAADNIAVVEGILAATDLNVEVGGGVRSIEVIERLVRAGVTRVVLGTALVRDPAFAAEAVNRFGGDALVAGIDAKDGEVAVSGWCGVTRVVLGTALVRDPAFAAEAVNRFGGDALVAGIDAKDGEVAVSGWCEGSGIAAHDLAARMADMGYRHLVYTDIARDGMQTGLDPQAYVDMARAFGHPVVAHDLAARMADMGYRHLVYTDIARDGMQTGLDPQAYVDMARAFGHPVVSSGGVASVADIERLAPVASSIEGVIAGRAIYEGALDVSSGVAACAAASAQA